MLELIANDTLVQSTLALVIVATHIEAYIFGCWMQLRREIREDHIEEITDADYPPMPW